MATRKGRELRDYIDADNYITLFASIFISQATITNLSKEVKNDYVVETLFERGKIAFHKPTGLWLPFDGNGGVDVYGDYTSYSLFGADGTHINAKPDDLYIFKANPKGVPIYGYLAQSAEKLAQIDNAIFQNLDAIRQMTILVTDNAELTKELQLVENKRRKGASFAVVRRTATAHGETQNLSTGAEYYIDRLQNAHDKEFKKALNILGVYTVSEKTERRITDEVQTMNDETDAYRNIIQKTFNTQAEEQNAPFRLVMRNSLQQNEKEVYENEED